LLRVSFAASLRCRRRLTVSRDAEADAGFRGEANDLLLVAALAKAERKQEAQAYASRTGMPC